jgi:hypothetical protein
MAWCPLRPWRHASNANVSTMIVTPSISNKSKAVLEMYVTRYTLKQIFIATLLLGCSHEPVQPDGCGHKPILHAGCGLEPNSGPCDALFKKYYYDKTEKRCKEFTWGGCEGVVPFETMEACKECECANTVR